MPKRPVRQCFTHGKRNVCCYDWGCGTPSATHDQMPMRDSIHTHKKQGESQEQNRPQSHRKEPRPTARCSSTLHPLLAPSPSPSPSAAPTHVHRLTNLTVTAACARQIKISRFIRAWDQAALALACPRLAPRKEGTRKRGTVRCCVYCCMEKTKGQGICPGRRLGPLFNP